MNNSLKVYRISEVAALWGMARSTVWHYVRTGKLKGLRLSPRMIVIPETELQRVLNRINVNPN